MRIDRSVAGAARHCADRTDRIAVRGERFILMRGNEPVAGPRRRPAGRGVGELANLVAPLPRLRPDDASAPAEQLDVARTDPWDDRASS